MFSTRKKQSFMIAIALMAALPLQAARAGDLKETLQLVPDDTWGFVVAKSLSNVDAKAAQLKEMFNLPFEGPISDMALGMLQLGDSIDKDSPVCAIMLDPNKYGGQEKSTAILVPTKDPKALLEKLSAEEGADGISKCTVMGEPAFAAVKGKTVILSPSEECAVKILKTKKSVGDSIVDSRMGVMSQSDLYISISLRSILAAYKEMIMPMMQMMAGSSGIGAGDIEKIFKILDEIHALEISVSLEKSGFAMIVLTVPHEGSDLQGLLADQKNSSESVLSLLPKEKFMFAFGGTATQSEHSEKFGNEHPVSGILKGLTHGAELDQDALNTLDAEIIKLQKSIKRYALSASALPKGDSMIGAALVAEVADSKEFLSGVRKFYKAFMTVSEDEDFGAIKKCIVHTADAESAAGKKLDTIKVDFASMPDSDPDDIKKMEKVIGKEFIIRFGAVDDKHVALSFGGGTKRYETICGAVKSGEKLGADAGITDASAHLPSPRSGEMFAAVDTIMTIVSEVAKAAGEEPFPFEIPTINAPVAASTSVQDKIGRFDLMIPMKLIKAVKEAYDKSAAASADEDFDEDDAGKDKPAKAKAKPAKEKEDSADSDDDEEAPKAKADSKAKPKAKKPEKKSDEESDE
ncbi:MAG: hypothetical protein HZA51_07100 [Planctomycetes bacterium]|nr:hypothetical protein [Planctomycetota bacterium]